MSRKFGVGMIILVFLFLYYPPIAVSNTMHFLAIYAYFYLFVGKGRGYLYLITGKLQRLILPFVVISIYSGFVAFANDASVFSAVYSMGMMALEVIPIAFCFSIKYITGNYKMAFVDIVLWAGTLQGIISLATFIIPSFKQLIINNMLSYGYNTVVSKMAGWRMYGWSYTLAFAMPIVQALLAVVAFYLGIRKKSHYLFYVPLLIFSSVVNARVGIVVIVLGILFVIIDSFNVSIFKAVRAIAVVGCVIWLISLALPLIEKSSPETYEWVTSGTDDIIDFLRGSDYSSDSYFNYISDKNKFEAPGGLRTVFGAGRTTTRGNTEYLSDVGYINDIWLGGIVYILMLYGMILSKLNKSFGYCAYLHDCGNWIRVGTIVLLMVCNVKGQVFSFNEIMNLVFLFIAFMQVEKLKAA